MAHQASWLGLGSGALARLRFGSALLRLSAGFRLDFGCIFASGFQLLGFWLDFIWLDFGLDFVRSLAFIRISIHSGLL